MNAGVKNWETGTVRGRETQSLRSAERALAVRAAFEFIAWKYRPKTRAAYASHLVDEECPTPSGRGHWTGNLVNQYMRRFGQTPKSLLEQFPERSGVDNGYQPEVYAAFRAEIQRINTPSERNGTWRSALEVEPTRGQCIFHEALGHGDFMSRTGVAKLLCQFDVRACDGSLERVDHECSPSRLLVFHFHLSPKERHTAQIEFWKRLIAGREMEFRRLINGWHL